jgi:hypothetical protein
MSMGLLLNHHAIKSYRLMRSIYIHSKTPGRDSNEMIFLRVSLYPLHEKYWILKISVKFIRHYVISCLAEN